MKVLALLMMPFRPNWYIGVSINFLIGGWTQITWWIPFDNGKPVKPYINDSICHSHALPADKHEEAPTHDDVIKWKHFPRYWPFVRGIHLSPVNSPHKDQWRGALLFSLNCVWINCWVNNREAGDLGRYRTHYDLTAMWRDIRFYHNIDKRYLKSIKR